MSIYLVDENTIFGEPQEFFCEVCGGQPKYDPTEGIGYCPTCRDNSVFVSEDEYERLHPEEFTWSAIAEAVAEVTK